MKFLMCYLLSGRKKTARNSQNAIKETLPKASQTQKIVSRRGASPPRTPHQGFALDPSPNLSPPSTLRSGSGPAVCEILEHIVASNLSKHFTDLNILYELQHGFRERRSCETQLIMLVDELSKIMQMGKQTYIILLDFSKAFEKVAHEKLLQKLHFYGIRGDTLKLIKGFLDNRKTVSFY